MVRNDRMRKLHKAFLRYHDPENWPLLRDALRAMGRADLIGNGKEATDSRLAASRHRAQGGCRREKRRFFAVDRDRQTSA